MTVPSAAPDATRVLVVDPDADLSELTATWLRMTGFDVRVATGGAQAVRMLDDVAFDVVVVDLPLVPGIDTAEVLAQVHARRPGCRTVVTSVLDVADYPAADAALPKPFSRAQLIAAVVARTEVPSPRAASTGDPVAGDRSAHA